MLSHQKTTGIAKTIETATELLESMKYNVTRMKSVVACEQLFSKVFSTEKDRRLTAFRGLVTSIVDQILISPSQPPVATKSNSGWNVTQLNGQLK